MNRVRQFSKWWGGAVAALMMTVGVAVPAHAQVETHTIDNTSYPSVIRVAIRPYNNPRGPISYVQTLGFQEYCEDVLPNEWVPSWDQESLRAGAIAIKMFAWYHSLHPVTIDGQTFDVDNTVNFQTFKYLTGRPETNQAVRDTWNIVYAPGTGEILQLDYRAGWRDGPNWPYAGTNVMSQWGSQHLATVGLPFLSILSFYYREKTLHWV